MKSTCPVFVIVVLAINGLGAERFRTDINPALRYYQAFAATAHVGEGDRNYLFTTEWRGHHLDARFGNLVSNYDGAFKLMRQAGLAEVPCDWGIDVSEGPMAILPGLAPAKNVAQIARLRALWHLQNGQQAEARDDLLTGFTLARNVAKDGVLISALVQLAMENIIFSSVAENFSQFSPEILQQIIQGLQTAPARTTIAQCIALEKTSFYGWFLRKIDDLKKENSGSEEKTLEGIRALLDIFSGSGEEGGPLHRDLADRVITAAGGTSDGVIKLANELKPMYQRVLDILVLPYGEFGPQIKAFDAEVEKSPNPLVPEFFRLFDKCRQKEFASQVLLAMVKAAAEYRIHGEEGFNTVMDPCGNGPFGMKRVALDGVDRGFELKSRFTGRGFDEVLIFVEKGGPPFQLNGKNAGQAVPLSANK